MKSLLWTLALLGTSASALAAQQSNVFVANSTGTVDVRRPDGSLVTTLSGAPYNFNQPYDVVTVPGRNLALVSNNAGGTLTIFDASTFAHLNNIDLGAIGGSNLRGMSVSADESRVFVAGQHFDGTSTSPAVFSVLLADMTPTLAGSIVDNGQIAEDCVVVSSSAVGGTGGGVPGRVYYTVPGGNYLGIINLNPAGPIGSLDLAQAPLANVNTPTQLERTPDQSVVFVGCTTADPGTVQRIARIGVAGNIASQPVVRTTIQSLPHVIKDIAFRPDGRGYINANIDSGSDQILEIDASGAAQPPAPRATAVPASGRIRFDGNPPRLYIGETSGTSQNYGISDASVSPVGAVAIQSVLPSSGPRAFAFMLPPAPPLISDVWPSGMVSAPGTSVEIRGANFDPACVVEFYDGAGVPSARAVLSRSSTRLVVDGDGLLPGIYEVRVTNPDTQSFSLADYFLSINPPAVAAPFVVTAPSRFEGYQLGAVPQYLSAADLLAAVNAGFGGYNPSNIRIFLQNGGGYLELTAAPPNMDLSNRSFWILSRLGGTLTLNAPAVGANLQAAGTQDKVVILRTGWNLVSQPTSNAAGGRMAMTDVSVYTDPALGSSIDNLEGSATAGDLSFPALYSGGAYTFLAAGDDLFAGQGYWIRNNTSGPIYLTFNTSDAQAKTIAAAAAFKTAASSELPPPPPGAALAEDDGTSGCGLTGLEPLALLCLLRRRRAK